MKKCLSLLTLLALLLSLCAPTALAESDKIVIGVITCGNAVPSYTEAVTNLGIYAQDLINEAGGLLGKEVEVVFESGENSADEYVNAANRLISRGDVTAIAGLATTTGALAVYDLITEAGIPTCTGGTSVNIPRQIGEDNVYLFGCRTSDEIIAKIAAQYLVNEKGCTNLGLLYGNSDFGQGALDIISEYCAEAGINLTAEGFNDTDTDITSQALKLVNAQVDGVVVWTISTTVPIIAQALYNNGVSVPIIGSNAVTQAENFGTVDVEWMDGWYGVTDFCMSREGSMQELIQDFHSRYGEDAYISSDGLTVYREIMWIADVIRQIDTDDRAALAKAMRESEGLFYVDTEMKAYDQCFMISTIDITQNVVVDGELVNTFITTYSAK